MHIGEEHIVSVVDTLSILSSSILHIFGNDPHWPSKSELDGLIFVE